MTQHQVHDTLLKTQNEGKIRHGLYLELSIRWKQISGMQKKPSTCHKICDENISYESTGKFFIIIAVTQLFSLCKVRELS